jgi:hypothetical protein
MQEQNNLPPKPQKKFAKELAGEECSTKKGEASFSLARKNSVN